MARSPIDVSAFLNVGLRGWARRLRTRPAKERIGRAASRGDDSAIVGNEERPPAPCVVLVDLIALIDLNDRCARAFSCKQRFGDPS